MFFSSKQWNETMTYFVGHINGGGVWGLVFFSGPFIAEEHLIGEQYFTELL